MRIVQSLFPLIALVTISCYAAPVAVVQSRGDISLNDARDLGDLDGRDLLAPVPAYEVREEFEELESRGDDDLDWLFARMYGWPGPGMQHKNEHNIDPTTGFHPVPANTYYTTPNNVYSGSDVNRYASNLVASIPHADPWNRRQSGRLKSYPKPSTGFRNSEADNPSPNHPHMVSYHAPIPAVRAPRRANTAPTRPGGSFKVGTDRIYGHRPTNDRRLSVGVSYHDPRKPIPPPQPGGTPSRNHPFSVAPPQQGGSMKVMGAKMKITAKKIGSVFKFGKKKD